MSEDKFGFFVPVDIIKSETDKDGKRWIQGIASTDSLDLQGERVSQNGIDYSYFLKHGFINDDHQSGPEHKVGEPTEARITKKGFWIKGFLYKGKDRADHWWEHLNALQRSGSKRKVGFSIQGKVQRRQGKRIIKCWIQDVAITASPVNTSTWAEIVKSLALENWCEASYTPWADVNKACDCKNCPCNVDKEKALSTSGQGRALIPESLEGANKVTTYKSINEALDECFKSMDVIRSLDDAVTYLQFRHGYSRKTAEAVADSIFTSKGLH